jgi:hypothetical protein
VRGGRRLERYIRSVSLKPGRAGAKSRANRVRRLAYRAYGLTIFCDLEIPELPPLRDLRSPGREHVNLHLIGPRREIEEPAQWLNQSFDPDGTPWLYSAKIEGGYLLRFPGMADFTLDRAGHEVICAHAADGASETTLRHLAIDHVMPRVLNVLGIESLHATAVETANGACAFIGDAGAGKSTLAASFHLSGMHAFCDDCLVIRDEGGRIVATPAYPGVRLWKDSMEALLAFDEQGLPVAHYTSKSRMLSRTAAFRADSLPLTRIYFLQRSTDRNGAVAAPSVTRISAAEAFPLLVGASFPLDLTDAAMLTRHFKLIVRIAATVQMRRLIIPNDFAALPSVREAVIADAEVQ